MIKIYGLLTPNVLKPVLVAEELSVNYEYVNVDLPNGEHRKPEFLARNAFGRVPVLEHEGRFLGESNAIMRYLANFTETPLYPREPWARAQVDQWLDFTSNHVGRYMSGIFFLKCVAGPIFKLPPNEAKLQELQRDLKHDLPKLEAHLAKNAYLTGSEISIADLGLFAMASPHKMAGIELENFPSLTKWYQAIRQRPSVAKAATMLPFPYLS